MRWIRPSRGQAWLRGHRVSSTEVGFNLWGKSPLPRNILISQDKTWIYGEVNERRDYDSVSLATEADYDILSAKRFQQVTCLPC